jgi:hypothetical protein
MENSYLPPSDRLIVIGRRFDTSSSLPLSGGFSSATAGDMLLICSVLCSVGRRKKERTKQNLSLKKEKGAGAKHPVGERNRRKKAFAVAVRVFVPDAGLWLAGSRRYPRTGTDVATASSFSLYTHSLHHPMTTTADANSCTLQLSGFSRPRGGSVSSIAIAIVRPSPRLSTVSEPLE